MKTALLIFLLCFVVKFSVAQNTKEQITATCLNYIEGFYEGDTIKLIKSLKPTLNKFGFWKNKNSGLYEPDGYMTYRQALDYAKNVLQKKNFAKSGTIKKIEVLDIQNTIASAKITAWWGVDYVLLSKQKDAWIIEQVLWEGPLQQ
jgi:hypothetical protein